jgi:hypothetical protein
MKNGVHHRRHRHESLAGRIFSGVLAIGAALLVFRALPDMIRYLRVRRM